MRRLYSVTNRPGGRFILAEHISNYQDACVAQAEYWAEGLRCHKEPDDKAKVYYIWVGGERLRQVRTLPGEVVRRRGSLKIRRQLEKAS